MNARDDMSDTGVLSAVRDSLSGMPLTGPPDVEAIMARGRARRHRRLISGVTGTAAVAAGATLAVTALTPASHPADRQPAAQLAAWTVTRLADGNISVTIRELTDPAGLQSILRADGVPASIVLGSQQNPACRPYPGGTPPQGSRPPRVTALLKRVFPKPYNEPANGRPSAPRILYQGSTVIVIDPSALPGNAGVQLRDSFGSAFFPTPRVVYASPRCTGN